MYVENIQPMNRIPVILDTDIGIDTDGALALVMLLKCPEPVLAVSIWIREKVAQLMSGLLPVLKAER
jgi:hypothetical protein